MHRLINIKTAKAYRTLSYEASCIMAGVKPIRIVLEEKIQLYEVKHNLVRREQEFDLPLLVKDWPHPAMKVNISKVNKATKYPIEIFTDGSKINDKVGASIAIFVDKLLAKECKFKLHNSCSNNQAEQIAILKSLEQLETLIELITDPTYVAVYTDSTVTLAALENNNIRNTIVEETRHKLQQFKNKNCIIHFGWVKVHIGIEGNEKADALAKEAANSNDQNIVYNKIPITLVHTELEKKGLEKWQLEWDNADKGTLCRTLFLNIQERLQLKIPITPEFTV